MDKRIKDYKSYGEVTEYPKGYISGTDRKSCDFCKYYEYKMDRPKQERVMLCTFMKPPIEIHMDDICDEFTEQ
tara:strand:- start:32848 stop:33066 length:219 start_codon:yes stop_codon:yes gene_type:complete